MNINRSVIQRVHHHVHELAARCIVRCSGDLCPRMSAREAIARGQDQLVSTDTPDRINSLLVVLQNQLRRHVVRLIVDSKNNVRIVQEARGELAPEFAELCCGGCVGVGRVADDGARVRLSRRVVVAHIVMGVDDGVGALGCDVVHGSGVFIEVLFKLSLKSVKTHREHTHCVIEIGAQACRHRAHPLHEECYTEEIDLLLVDEDVYRRVVREIVLDEKLSRQHVRAKLASGLRTETSIFQSERK